MHDEPCPRESEVLRAVEEGLWPADLRTHADGCQACHEVEAVAAALREVVAAEAAEAAMPLPAAGDLWWRAAWQARREARARALRPLDTLERSEPLVALVALVVLLVARGDLVLRAAARMLSLDGNGQALAAVMPAAVLPFLFIGLGIGALVILVGLGAVVAND